MKLKKIFSAAAASLLAAGVVATSASADWQAIPGSDDGVLVATGNYGVVIFCNVETDMPMKDHGIDISKAASVAFTVRVCEDSYFKPGDDPWKEYVFDGMIGGGVVTSWHMSNIPNDDPQWGTYNWNSKEWWGVLDPEAANPGSYDIEEPFEYIEGEPTYINTLDTTKAAFLETLENYTYRIKAPIVNPIADGVCTAEDLTDFRVFLQGWGSGWAASHMECIRTVLYDADNKPIIVFDEKGNVVEATADDEKEPVMPEPPSEEEPAEEPTSSEDNTPASTPESSTAVSAPTSTPASTPTSTASESSGLPVGAIVGIVAGVVAVIAVVVVVVVKKKKG